jgi:hypothetical protein
MKRACRAAAFFAGVAGTLVVGRADDAKPPAIVPAPAPALQATPQFVAPFTPDGNTSGNFDADPESAVEHSAELRAEYLRQSELTTYQTQAQRQAYESDWMLRGYTAQLNAAGIDTAADRDAAAAQEVPDPSAPPRNTLDPLLPPTQDASNAPPKRPQDNSNASEAPAADTPQPLYLAPLLPTEGGTTPTKTVTRLDAWGSTTSLETITTPSLGPNFLPSPKDNLNSTDSGPESSLDVPGLTAARQGLGDGSDPDGSDQQMESMNENDNRARKDFLMPTVAGNDASEFFKRQSEALAAPNTPLHPAAAANIPLGPPPAPPSPSTKMPPPEGIRSHVDDPFDIIGGHRY